MGARDVELVRQGYEAFARGDLQVIGEILAPDVRWHGADDEDPEGGCRGRDQAIRFISDALAQGVGVEVLDVRQAGKFVLVILQSDREDEFGHRVPHAELVTVRGGRIDSMVVYEDIELAEAATSGAGRPPHA